MTLLLLLLDRSHVVPVFRRALVRGRTANHAGFYLHCAARHRQLRRAVPSTSQALVALGVCVHKHFVLDNWLLLHEIMLGSGWRRKSGRNVRHGRRFTSKKTRSLTHTLALSMSMCLGSHRFSIDYDACDCNLYVVSIRRTSLFIIPASLERRYNTLVLQYGYLTFFAVAFPLVSALALLRCATLNLCLIHRFTSLCSSRSF